MTTNKNKSHKNKKGGKIKGKTNFKDEEDFNTKKDKKVSDSNE